mmetsp:Transcript_84843/g.169512  ORF Transcript_84843/g.169512 Transcript_84843/m.169512 type:complete len:373 (+) Transcript_84843:308-1426(+)
MSGRELVVLRVLRGLLGDELTHHLVGSLIGLARFWIGTDEKRLVIHVTSQVDAPQVLVPKRQGDLSGGGLLARHGSGLEGFSSVSNLRDRPWERHQPELLSIVLLRLRAADEQRLLGSVEGDGIAARDELSENGEGRRGDDWVRLDQRGAVGQRQRAEGQYLQQVVAHDRQRCPWLEIGQRGRQEQLGEGAELRREADGATVGLDARQIALLEHAGGVRQVATGGPALLHLSHRFESHVPIEIGDGATVLGHTLGLLHRQDAAGRANDPQDDLVSRGGGVMGHHALPLRLALEVGIVQEDAVAIGVNHMRHQLLQLLWRADESRGRAAPGSRVGGRGRGDHGSSGARIRVRDVLNGVIVGAVVIGSVGQVDD